MLEFVGKSFILILFSIEIVYIYTHTYVILYQFIHNLYLIYIRFIIL